MSRASLDASLVFLAMMSLIVGYLMLRTVRAPHRIVRRESDEAIELGGALAGSLLVAAPLHPLGFDNKRVSLQLPCYAEPPEVVIQTMNRLAALDYDNFEVLVCDN